MPAPTAGTTATAPAPDLGLQCGRRYPLRGRRCRYPPWGLPLWHWRPSWGLPPRAGTHFGDRTATAAPVPTLRTAILAPVPVLGTGLPPRHRHPPWGPPSRHRYRSWGQDCHPGTRLGAVALALCHTFGPPAPVLGTGAALGHRVRLRYRILGKGLTLGTATGLGDHRVPSPPPAGHHVPPRPAAAGWGGVFFGTI